MIHHLKTWPEYYRAVVHPDPMKRKRVEIRLNDRNYQVGDVLVLQEYYPETKVCTGHEYEVEVTHILSGTPWLGDGYIAMSIRPVGVFY